MRDRATAELEECRRVHPTLGESPEGATWGYFELGPLRIISGGSDERWEHVSVSCHDRTPSWEEMSLVKALFWSDDETVLQFHPKRSEYVNQMPHCLHLWKQRKKNHVLPPGELI